LLGTFSYSECRWNQTKSHLILGTLDQQGTNYAAAAQVEDWEQREKAKPVFIFDVTRHKTMNVLNKTGKAITTGSDCGEV
jgi:hypothetical protein